MQDTAGPGSTGPARGPRHAAPGDARPALPRLARSARHRDRSGRPGPAARGALLAGVLAVAVVAVVLVPRVTGGPPPAGRTSDPPSPSAAPGPAGPGPAEWLSAALPSTTGLLASAAVREDLAAHGVPADRLREAEDGDVPGGLLAVTGTVPPGSRVVARFDRPGGDGEILVADPRPGEPSAAQRERRRSLGEALLANPATGADPAVAAALRSGEVDPRLLGVLAGLAASDGVRIAGLPPLPGEEDTGTPARRVLVDALGGAPVPADPAATERLRRWLAAQLPPFAPDDVQVRDDGVLVSFHYASAPDALVPGAAG